MADDLQQERNRLANRRREQLWRYYPQMLELADDLAADWFLDFWSQAPTPAKAARLRATTIVASAGRCRSGSILSVLPRWVHRDLPRSAPPDSWRSLRCARVPPVDYLDKPSHPSRRQRAADIDRTNQEHCQPCIRSIVSGMFPVAHQAGCGAAHLTLPA